MEVQGKIKLVGNVQEITDSFRKRELVIVTQEQYPQTLCVEFVQDKRYSGSLLWQQKKRQKFNLPFLQI